MRDAAPFAAFLCFLYVGLGALCAAKGLSWIETVAMTALLYSTPLQMLMVQNHDAGWATILPIILVMNARFALMAAVLARSFSSEPLGRIACYITLLVPTVFANCRTRFNRDDGHALTYFAGIGLPLYLTSLFAIMAGHLLGPGWSNAGILAFDRFALALFLTVLAGRLWPHRAEVAAFAIGFLATPLLGPAFGALSVLGSPMLIGSSVAVWGEIGRRRR
nr:AzlC family ABC transporter permease [Acidimangrovimonas sediminis]